MPFPNASGAIRTVVEVHAGGVQAVAKFSSTVAADIVHRRCALARVPLESVN